MENKISQEKAIKNMLTSVRMEGFSISSEMEDLCKQVLCGKLSLRECLDQLK